MSEKLKEARAFLERYLPFVPREDQPVFHTTGGVGWINDPNGFSLYQGEYHLFYQYYPYAEKWGTMHWGHQKTRDFIHWEILPVALAPDMDYDRDGCYSGGAVEMPDGRQLLLYTGVREQRMENGTTVNFQTQCAAVGDGMDYEKYAGNPVITAADLPAGGSPIDFRDPKIWREDGKYRMVAGNRPADGSGSVLLYESEDGFHWRFCTVLATCDGKYGRMWECPDFFPLDGKQVLLVSPQEMRADGLEFHPGNGTVCMVGSWAAPDGPFVREQVQAVDYGIDFYAPQTLLTPDGRRVMIAWMQNWETSGCRLESLRFMGQMTLPRELRVREGRLIQTPVRELEGCRREALWYKDALVSAETRLAGVSGRVLDMIVRVRPEDPAELYQSFRIELAKDGSTCTSIRYKPASGVVRVDRTRSGFPHDIVSVRDFAVRNRGGEIELRIVMDRYSLELFVNGGEQAATFTIYTPQEADVISFHADGAARMDVEHYKLEV